MQHMILDWILDLQKKEKKKTIEGHYWTNWENLKVECKLDTRIMLMSDFQV